MHNKLNIQQPIGSNLFKSIKSKLYQLSKEACETWVVTTCAQNYPIMVTWVVLNYAQNCAIMVTSVVLNCGQNYTIMVTWVVPNCAPNYATMVTFFHGPKNNESLWSTAARHSYGRIGCKKLQEAPKAKCPNNQHALKIRTYQPNTSTFAKWKAQKRTSLRTCRK
jgi:hypothetical protein